MPDPNQQDQNRDEPVRPVTVPPIGTETAVPGQEATDQPVPITTTPEPLPPDESRPGEPKSRLPHTRVGTAWVGLCALAIVAIAFIIFMLQNTGRVRVTFLSTHASLPLALALLIAAVAGVLIVLAVGTIRITQLRRMARRRNRADSAR